MQAVTFDSSGRNTEVPKFEPKILHRRVTQNEHNNNNNFIIFTSTQVHLSIQTQ